MDYDDMLSRKKKIEDDLKHIKNAQDELSSNDVENKLEDVCGVIYAIIRCSEAFAEKKEWKGECKNKIVDDMEVVVEESKNKKKTILAIIDQLEEKSYDLETELSILKDDICDYETEQKNKEAAEDGAVVGTIEKGWNNVENGFNKFFN